MSPVNGKFVVAPTLDEVFEAHRLDVGAKLRVCAVGIINSYDPETRTATVALSEDQVLGNGRVIRVDKPLVDVPVFTLQGGGAHVGLPVAADDECLLVFCDHNIDAWFKSGGQQTPFDARQHSVSDAFALVGLNSLARPLESALEATEAGVATADAKVGVDADTDLLVAANASGSLKAALTSLATALTTLNSIISSMTTASIAAGTPQAAAAANATAIAAVQTALTALLKP